LLVDLRIDPGKKTQIVKKKEGRVSETRPQPHHHPRFGGVRRVMGPRCAEQTLAFIISFDKSKARARSGERNNGSLEELSFPSVEEP